MFVFILVEDCSTGFYGFQPDCKTCPYPSYGLKCQSLCVCPKKSCNHVKGCFALIPDTGIFAIICTYYAVWSFLRGGEFQNLYSMEIFIILILMYCLILKFVKKLLLKSYSNGFFFQKAMLTKYLLP